MNNSPIGEEIILSLPKDLVYLSPFPDVAHLRLRFPPTKEQELDCDLGDMRLRSEGLWRRIAAATGRADADAVGGRSLVCVTVQTLVPALVLGAGVGL
ncbi:hypothetical protein J6590_034683 [Homalodisca vitripennis]|nr:hypothetical protein J6590_034683 [Homalodisca vitripennis]